MTGPVWTPEVSAAHDARLDPEEDTDLTPDEIREAEDYWAEKEYDAMKDWGML